MTSPEKRALLYRYPESRTNRLPSSRGPSVDALTVAGSVFEIEKWLHDGIRTTELTLPLHGGPTYNWKRLQNALTDVLLFVLTENVRISYAAPTAPLKKLKDEPELLPISNICLFSGGVDSLSGILAAKDALRDVEGVFCAHSDQARIVKIVEELRDAAFVEKGLQLHKISVPSVGIRGYAQLRGFLYCVAAAAWMHLLGSTSLIVTECGPTMYQPMFSPLDSVTMTTHPVVLGYAKTAIETILKRSVGLFTPFEDFTKAEVMAICPRPDLIARSHSCISQRFGAHDGTCFGCVIRRLASTAAGIRDVEYARNPISDEKANAGNLLSLLTYCHDLLTDYGAMEPFEIEKIELYGKRDLFRRFALDQFAAIHILRDAKKEITPAVRRIYESVALVVGTPALETRLHALRTFGVPVNWRRTPPSTNRQTNF
jgi:7-cyano-7-deazaguanine synthase in queuosine biosynthesis